jgi:hypothetical protein
MHKLSTKTRIGTDHSTHGHRSGALTHWHSRAEEACLAFSRRLPFPWRARATLGSAPDFPRDEKGHLPMRHGKTSLPVRALFAVGLGTALLSGVPAPADDAIPVQTTMLEVVRQAGVHLPGPASAEAAGSVRMFRWGNSPQDRDVQLVGAESLPGGWNPMASCDDADAIKPNRTEATGGHHDLFAVPSAVHGEPHLTPERRPVS